MAEIKQLPAGGLQPRPPEPINSTHDVSGFSSAREALNHWLKRHALKNEGRNSRTYVVAHGARVIGYYTLAAGGIERAALPNSLRHNSPEKVPMIILGRLATDRAYEGRGIGGGMLSEAISRMLNSAGEIGVRGLLVHALDDDLVKFYQRYNFVQCALGERTLLLPVETALRAISSRG